MNVVIDRKWKKETYTIGRVYIDNNFFSNSMEDRDRGLNANMTKKEIAAKKVYGKTAIPAGEYEVRMTYSPKYKRFMPQVIGVKGFEGIRIHSGNTAADSLGCILLGKNDKPGWISNSKKACEEFERLLNAAGGQCKLNIV